MDVTDKILFIHIANHVLFNSRQALIISFFVDLNVYC